MILLTPPRASLLDARVLLTFMTTEMQNIARQITSGFRELRVRPILSALICCFAFAISCVIAEGQQVVTNGKFTNIYVYVPNSPGETWDQHMVRFQLD